MIRRRQRGLRAGEPNSWNTRRPRRHGLRHAASRHGFARGDGASRRPPRPSARTAQPVRPRLLDDDAAVEGVLELANRGAQPCQLVINRRSSGFRLRNCHSDCPSVVRFMCAHCTEFGSASHQDWPSDGGETGAAGPSPERRVTRHLVQPHALVEIDWRRKAPPRCRDAHPGRFSGGSAKPGPTLPFVGSSQNRVGVALAPAVSPRTRARDSEGRSVTKPRQLSRDTKSNPGRIRYEDSTGLVPVRVAKTDPDLLERCKHGRRSNPPDCPRDTVMPTQPRCDGRKRRPLRGDAAAAGEVA